MHACLASADQAKPRGSCEEAATLLPDNVDVAINLAGADILQRQYKQAVPILKRASELAPTNAMVWINLAAAHLGRLELSGPQQQERAIAAYERALKLIPAPPTCTITWA